MPTGYRIERSKNARAVCRNKECKDEAVKIQKGELRFGSLVTIPSTEGGENTSWHWKHWGCVTPQVLANVVKYIEGEYELFDGLVDLEEEDQETIKRALEQGHVDDDDWKGDLEVNRPGMKGFRVKTPKKKAKAEDDAEEPESPTKPAPKKRGRPKKEVDAESEPEAPPPKKARGRPKKVTEADAAGEPADATEAAPAPKKGRARKKATKASAEEAADEPAVSAHEQDEAPPPKANQGRKKKTATGTADANGASGETAAQPKKRASRAKKAA